MDDLEAAVRCLEVAERMAKAQNRYDAKSVVEIQTALYSHVTSATASDKPAPATPPGRPAKAPKPQP